MTEPFPKSLIVAGRQDARDRSIGWLGETSGAQERGEDHANISAAAGYRHESVGSAPGL